MAIWCYIIRLEKPSGTPRLIVKGLQSLYYNKMAISYSTRSMAALCGIPAHIRLFLVFIIRRIMRNAEHYSVVCTKGGHWFKTRRQQRSTYVAIKKPRSF